MSNFDLLNQMLSQAGFSDLSPEEGQAFDGYLSLLLKWNAKLNLTAIRDIDRILRRHFFECIICARSIPSGIETLLDFGSGGGFPGVPIAICRPEIQVTLGESQNKKAVFLREVVRTLGLKAKVEQGRAEDLSSSYQAVALRAVDKMEQAIPMATAKLLAEGFLIMMASRRDDQRFRDLASGVQWLNPIAIPGTQDELILLGKKLG